MAIHSLPYGVTGSGLFREDSRDRHAATVTNVGAARGHFPSQRKVIEGREHVSLGPQHLE